MEKFNTNEKELALLKEKLKISQSLVKIGFWELNRVTKVIRLSDEAGLILKHHSNKKELSLDEFCAFAATNEAELIKTRLLLLIDKKSSLDLEFTLQKENAIIKIIANCTIETKEAPNTIIGIVQNITEQKNTETILKRAKEKAEESDVLKSAFLANMSHEIRTPLNAILGFSRLLTNPDIENNQRKEYSEYITSSANNLLNLIRDIIDVSKIEAGKISLEKSKCLVNKTLKELKFTFEKEKNSQSKQHIDIRLNAPLNDDNFSIYTDPYRFHQILVNLIGNALKFIETGFIEFGYVIHNKSLLQFYVKDTGIGIPEDKIDLIFSRFGQIIDNKIKNPGGTGLGLSITKHLVERLGGQIWVESEQEVGTTFYFTLPFEQVENKDFEQNTIAGAIEKLEIKELRILAVEDDPINMILLEDTLKVHISNLQIFKAFDGLEALELLKKHDFDLIIMDIRMPKMDGYTTTEKIRQEFKAPKNQTPILGLSAHALKTEIEKGKKLGMSDFLSKPLQAEELLVKIKKLTSLAQLEKDPADKDTDKEHITGTTTIDLSFFVKLFKNNQDKINKTLKEYSKQVPIQIESMKKFLVYDEIEKLKTQAHSLKSTFKYIGRPDLSDTAKKIETMSVDNKSVKNDIEKAIATIEQEWEQISFEITDKVLKNA
jgi:signal transduction histidine kinase/CheY-like chemotaxis protein/HPt (histidine-containing phosphotransfer) domain-containing protein